MGDRAEKKGDKSEMKTRRTRQDSIAHTRDNHNDISKESKDRSAPDKPDKKENKKDSNMNQTQPPKSQLPKSQSTPLELTTQQQIERNDQPKITDAFFNNTKHSPSEPDSIATQTLDSLATSADIQKILLKLEKTGNQLNEMDKTSKVIKNELKDIKDDLAKSVKKVDIKVEKLSKKVDSITENYGTKMKELEKTVVNVEQSIVFQTNQFDTEKAEIYKRLDKQEKKYEQLQEQYDALSNQQVATTANQQKVTAELDAERKKNLERERHDRKYNLLLYGIEEKDKENIYKVIKRFLRKKVGLEKETVEHMEFAHAHRMPTRGDGHRPIIVRFLRIYERDLVMSQVYSGVLPKGLSILIDLPQEMKQMRYELSKVAYKLRNPQEGSENKFQTRILELTNKVVLQVRRNKEEKWRTYKGALLHDIPGWNENYFDS